MQARRGRSRSPPKRQLSCRKILGIQDKNGTEIGIGERTRPACPVRRLAERKGVKAPGETPGAATETVALPKLLLLFHSWPVG